MSINIHKYISRRSYIKYVFTMLWAVTLSLTMMRAVASNEIQTTYITMRQANLGWVNISMPNEGMYIYGQDAQDREASAAFLIDKPVRQQFDFFSSQEEEALWHLHEEQVADAEVAKIKARKSQPAKRHQAIKIIWPKVLVESNQICVPKIEFSESTNWKEYLICWNEGL